MTGSCEDLTFSEVVARVPSGQRGDRAHVLAALWKLQAIRPASVPTKTVTEFLKRHLRGKAPRNVADVLAKLSPFVERITQSPGRIQWHITDTGLRRLGAISSLPIAERRQCTLDISLLHPRISMTARQLFLNKHYSEAVGRAVKELNVLVRERTGRTRDDGVAMMHQVFSETETGTPRLLATSLREEWERDLQRGLKFMMVGCQSGFANVDKHGYLPIESELEALECLTMISYLARRIDKAICSNRAEPHAA